MSLPVGPCQLFSWPLCPDLESDSKMYWVTLSIYMAHVYMNKNNSRVSMTWSLIPILLSSVAMHEHVC